MTQAAAVAEWPGGKPKSQQPGPSQAPAQQHYAPQYEPPQYTVNSNDVAGKVIDAYRINPMLTGLLLLNLLIFCGAGWYLNVVQERTAMYVKSRDGDLKELQNKALDMASKCIVPDTSFQQRSYPQPQPYYPQYSPAPSYQQPSPQPPPAPQPQPQAIAPTPPRQTPFKQ
jgi:hypothetical protein